MLNSITRKTKNKKARQVGRGGTRGKTSGRGTKGQNARAGRKKRPELRDIIKKLPKLRGRGKNSNVSFQVKPIAVNLETLSAAFPNGGKVSGATLVAAKVISIYKGKTPSVKIVSGGEMKSKVTIVGCAVSALAKEKIEKAGGKIS